MTKRQREANLVIIRALQEAYKFWEFQLAQWKTIEAELGIDTSSAQADSAQVLTESKLLIDLLKSEIENSDNSEPESML